MPQVTVSFANGSIQVSPNSVSVSDIDPAVNFEVVQTQPPITLNYIGFKETVGSGTAMGVPTQNPSGEWSVARNSNPGNVPISFPYNVYVQVGTGAQATLFVLDPEIINEPDGSEPPDRTR